MLLMIRCKLLTVDNVHVKLLNDMCLREDLI